jgi:hypothetical protein
MTKPPPDLKRNMLSLYGKRMHLWSLGVRGKEADELLRKLYPEEFTDQDKPKDEAS